MRHFARSIIAFGFAVPLLPNPSFAAETATNIPMCGSESTMTTEKIDLSSPAVGGEVEVEIGASVISTGRGVIAIAAISLPDGATISGRKMGADYVITIPAGRVASPHLGEGLFPVTEYSFRFLREKGERRGVSKPDVYLYMDPVDGVSLKARLGFGFFKQDVAVPATNFQLEKCMLTNASAFRREIVYSGGAKGVVNFQFREYVNQMARSAFSQDLSYDLSQGNEIGFKGARIKIIKVTNTGLRYVVLKPFTE